MIVTMITMWMMQVAIDQVIGMVTMRNGFVTAIGPMHMIRCVTAATVCWGASCGVRRADFDLVFINMIAMHMMQMAIVQIIHMIAMLDPCMTTTGTMLMSMILMRLTLFGHVCSQGFKK